MRRTYRATVFPGLGFGVPLILALTWLAAFYAGVPEFCGIWVSVFFGVWGISVAPYATATVTVGEDGITQRIFRRRFIRCSEVVSWERHFAPEDCDGIDTILTQTKDGCFTLYPNCIYGKRVDEMERELKQRVPQARGPRAA